MSLCNLNQVLYKAQKEKYGVLATVLFNFDFTEAVLNAAEERRSPIILMISEPLQRKCSYFNFKRLILPIRNMAEESSVPVVLHLDHGQNYESIIEYIDSGLTSVMISGSGDLEKNINKAKEITEIAHKYGVTKIIQPGGSIRDKDSIKACNELGIKMVFTGNRHFKH